MRTEKVPQTKQASFSMLISCSNGGCRKDLLKVSNWKAHLAVAFDALDAFTLSDP